MVFQLSQQTVKFVIKDVNFKKLFDNWRGTLGYLINKLPEIRCYVLRTLGIVSE